MQRGEKWRSWLLVPLSECEISDHAMCFVTIPTASMFSSTLLSIFNRLRSPSLKEEKFLLQRQRAEPLTHSAAPGREQTTLLTSGVQWCHGDVNASNCKSHTQTHTCTRAQPRSRLVVAFQSERRRLRRGDSQFWKSGQQTEDGCDRGGDRTRYVCFHPFVSCRSEKKKKKKSGFIFNTIAGLWIMWVECVCLGRNLAFKTLQFYNVSHFGINPPAVERSRILSSDISARIRSFKKNQNKNKNLSKNGWKLTFPLSAATSCFW